MSADARIWLAIAGLALATYAIRFSFLGLLGGRPVPPGLRRALAFVPVTVLPALIAPMVLLGEDGGPTDDLQGLAAALAALAAGMLTRNLLAGILAGGAGFAAALLVL
jgi:branched-subunit amino acid transport protein